MIQFPICPPEVFAWWAAQWFCSYVFVQYSPLVFIETQYYGYMHLNFQFCVCNSLGFILHESHIEMGIALSSKLLASEERCSEICMANTYHFLLLESRMTRGAYFRIWRLLRLITLLRQKTIHWSNSVVLNLSWPPQKNIQMRGITPKSF